MKKEQRRRDKKELGDEHLEDARKFDDHKNVEMEMETDNSTRYKEPEESGIDTSRDDDQEGDLHDGDDDFGLQETMCHLEEFREFVLMLMRQ